MKTKLISLITILLIFLPTLGFANSSTINCAAQVYKHAIETSPLSPLLQAADAGIWGIKYEYAINESSEFKLGLAYMNIYFEEGNTNSPALILGYRKFLRPKFYVEYEIWPGYDRFYEKHEQKYYKGFDIWNEFRIGYQKDFAIRDLPLFLNVAWPFGFGLYSSNKPDSFYDRMDENFGSKYFFHFPLLFVGYRF